MLFPMPSKKNVNIDAFVQVVLTSSIVIESFLLVHKLTQGVKKVVFIYILFSQVMEAEVKEWQACYYYNYYDWWEQDRIKDDREKSAWMI